MSNYRPSYRSVELQRFDSSTANIRLYVPGRLQLVRYYTSPACIHYAISAAMLHVIQRTL